MLKLSKFLFTSLAICLGMLVNAQVTTGSISGSVKDQNGKVLEGATVTAVHLPSGTKYNTVSKKGGSFNIPNARIGGPYKLSVEYVGQKKYDAEGFSVILGEVYEVNVVDVPVFSALDFLTPPVMMISEICLISSPITTFTSYTSPNMTLKLSASYFF